MTNHLQFAFHPIAIPTLRTLMIDWERKSSRIIPESALALVVHPISSLIDLHPNASLRLVTPLPTHMGQVQTEIKD
jgi:hypothetical protein